jgi:hypothetical protein
MMGESVGMVHCGQRPSMFLPSNDGTGQIDCSPDTAHDIDAEVKGLLDDAYVAAKSILTQPRDKLNLVADELVKGENARRRDVQAAPRRTDGSARRNVTIRKSPCPTTAWPYNSPRDLHQRDVCRDQLADRKRPEHNMGVSPMHCFSIEWLFIRLLPIVVATANALLKWRPLVDRGNPR